MCRVSETSEGRDRNVRSCEVVTAGSGHHTWTNQALYPHSSKRKELQKPIAGEVLVLVFLAPPKRTELCVLFMVFFLNRCALWFRALMVSGCACRGGRGAALLRNVSRAVRTSRRHQRTSGPTSGAAIAIILYKYICLQKNVTGSRCFEDVFISSLSLCQAV